MLGLHADIVVAPTVLCAFLIALSPPGCTGEFMKIMDFRQESQMLKLSWRRGLGFVLVAKWGIQHSFETTLKARNIRS